MSGQRRVSSVDVDDAAFLSGLQRKIGQLKLTSERQLDVLAVTAQNNARELCPVDTGRLRSSIVMRGGRDKDGPYREIGTNVEYAPHVEFGTSRAPAQPFIRPAIAEAIRDAPRILGRIT